MNTPKPNAAPAEVRPTKGELRAALIANDNVQRDILMRVKQGPGYVVHYLDYIQRQLERVGARNHDLLSDTDTTRGFTINVPALPPIAIESMEPDTDAPPDKLPAGYDYKEQKSAIFSEAGQRMFLKIRDHTKELLAKAGAVRCQEMMAGAGGGDSWNMLACVDRLVELGEIREIPQERCAWEHRVFVLR